MDASQSVKIRRLIHHPKRTINEHASKTKQTTTQRHTQKRTCLPEEVLVLQRDGGDELVLDVVLQLEDGELPAGGGHLVWVCFVGVQRSMAMRWTDKGDGWVDTQHTHTNINPPLYLLEGLELALVVGAEDGDLELGRLDLRVRQPVVHLCSRLRGLGCMCVRGEDEGTYALSLCVTTPHHILMTLSARQTQKRRALT